MRPADMPPIKNRPLYIYRVLGKWLSFFIFGLGTALQIILFLPIIRLFFHPRERFRKYGRRFISASLRLFVSIMHFIGVVNLETEDREKFQNQKSKIIVANHPSILDIVMLFSLVPNADCIVNSYLKHHIVMGVIRHLYILNSLGFTELIDACTESLKQGNCLIIFPEGTRTPRKGKVIVKKGAARIALASGCGVIPVHIGGTDKYGLGKRDPWTAFNPQERYIYKISMGEEINPENYKSFSPPAAARALNNDITARIFPKKVTDA